MVIFALLLVVIGAVIVLAVIGHATSIITGLAVSLQARALPVAVIAGTVVPRTPTRASPAASYP